MPHTPHDELRQIKWILAGILACLAVIAVAMVPEALLVVIIIGIAYLLARLLLATSETARAIWMEVSTLWRR